MRILWITNGEPDKAARHFNRKCYGASWLSYASSRISQSSDVQLFILNCSQNYDWIDIEGIQYHGFVEEDFLEALAPSIEKINPDVIHIWGTEYAHFKQTVDYAHEIGISEKIIVSIQGLVSIIDKYYCFDLPEYVIRRKTLYEVVRRTSIIDAHKALHKRGNLEKEGLKNVYRCIGRTDFDRAIVSQYNPQAKYYKCNEILRESFYHNKWKYENCEKHSIVFSQTASILKGFHVLLEAICIVKKFYPDVKVYAIGKSPFSYERISEKIKKPTFVSYLGELIIKYNLLNNVEFVGYLEEKKMVKHYLRGNVFVCASGIENSSNSVGEAMYLGLPIVASDVGGIKTFLNHQESGILYQSDSANMLADGIIQVFENNEYAIRLGHNARERAQLIFDPQSNTENLSGIYSDVIATYKDWQ